MSNHIIHKCSNGFCIWASDPLIDRIYKKYINQRIWSPKTKAIHILLLMLWFDEKSMSNVVRTTFCCCRTVTDINASDDAIIYALPHACDTMQVFLQPGNLTYKRSTQRRCFCWCKNNATQWGYARQKMCKWILLLFWKYFGQGIIF